MMAATGSKKHEGQAQAHYAAAEGASAMKKIQMPVDAWEERPLEMKALETRA